MWRSTFQLPPSISLSLSALLYLFFLFSSLPSFSFSSLFVCYVTVWPSFFSLSLSLFPSLPSSAIVEAVKCLCNIILTNHHLTTPTAALGVLHGLGLRLGLVRNVDLPSDVLTFDLRLLFLMTACGIAERCIYTYKILLHIA